MEWTYEQENPKSRLRMARIENSYTPSAKNKTVALVFDPKHIELEEYLQFCTNGKMASRFKSIFHNLVIQF